MPDPDLAFEELFEQAPEASDFEQAFEAAPPAPEAETPADVSLPDAPASGEVVEYRVRGEEPKAAHREIRLEPMEIEGRVPEPEPTRPENLADDIRAAGPLATLPAWLLGGPIGAVVAHDAGEDLPALTTGADSRARVPEWLADVGRAAAGTIAPQFTGDTPTPGAAAVRAFGQEQGPGEYSPGAFAGGVLRGATMGHSDELAGAIADPPVAATGALGWGLGGPLGAAALDQATGPADERPDYRAGRDLARRRQTEAERSDPTAHLAGTAVGTLPHVLAPSPAALAGGRGFGAGLRAIGALGAESGALGALQASGESDAPLGSMAHARDVGRGAGAAAAFGSGAGAAVRLPSFLGGLARRGAETSARLTAAPGRGEEAASTVRRFLEPGNAGPYTPPSSAEEAATLSGPRLREAARRGAEGTEQAAADMAAEVTELERLTEGPIDLDRLAPKRGAVARAMEADPPPVDLEALRRDAVAELRRVLEEVEAISPNADPGLARIRNLWRGTSSRTPVLQRRISAIENAASPADVYMALDQAKRDVGRAISRSMRGEARNAGELLADTAYRPLRAMLEDSGRWGEGAVAMQAPHNEAWTAAIPARRAFGRRFLEEGTEGSAQAFTGRNEEVGNAGAIRRMLEGADDPTQALDRQAFRRGLETRRDLAGRLSEYGGPRAADMGEVRSRTAGLLEGLGAREGEAAAAAQLADVPTEAGPRFLPSPRGMINAANWADHQRQIQMIRRQAPGAAQALEYAAARGPLAYRASLHVLQEQHPSVRQALQAEREDNPTGAAASSPQEIQP